MNTYYTNNIRYSNYADRYIDIDSGIKGWQLKIYIGTISSKDNNGSIISINSEGTETNLVGNLSNKSGWNIITIPEDSVRLKFHCQRNLAIY